jgi:hypothetical protein
VDDYLPWMTENHHLVSRFDDVEATGLCFANHFLQRRECFDVSGRSTHYAALICLLSGEDLINPGP